MTIKGDIRKELSTGPKSLRYLATLTGHDLESIRNAKGYLQADGIVRQVAGQKPGAPDILFELVPVPQASHHGNVLKSPEWVPPKVMRRAEIDAPGLTVRRYLTGEVLNG